MVQYRRISRLGTQFPACPEGSWAADRLIGREENGSGVFAQKLTVRTFRPFSGYPRRLLQRSLACCVQEHDESRNLWLASGKHAPSRCGVV